MAGFFAHPKAPPLIVCSREKRGAAILGSISLCMIVKNEEKTLPRCLSSIAHLVDELIIVDTGSEDGTKEVARPIGAKVLAI